MLEYAKDICRRAAIPWNDEWAKDLEGLNNKIDINKKIFLDLASRTVPDKEITPEIQAFLKAITPPGSVRKKIEGFTLNIDHCRRNIMSKHQEIGRYIAEMAENRKELTSLFDIKEDDMFGEEIKKVVATRLYTSPQVAGERHLLFRTTNEVVIHQKDPASGVDMKVGFGCFDVQVDMVRGLIAVRPTVIKPDLNPDGYYHPHVGTNGRGDNTFQIVCWGNAEPTYARFTTHGELCEAMKALWLILCTYNDSSPYRELLAFWKVRNKELLANEPRTLARFDKRWLRAEEWEELRELDHEDCLDTGNEDDDGYAQVKVQLWAYHYPRLGIVDDSKVYIAGPRGGHPVEIDWGLVGE